MYLEAHSGLLGFFASSIFLHCSSVSRSFMGCLNSYWLITGPAPIRDSAVWNFICDYQHVNMSATFFEYSFSILISMDISHNCGFLSFIIDISYSTLKPFSKVFDELIIFCCQFFISEFFFRDCLEPLENISKV